MRLTREEKEMLEGKYGEPVQKNMEILVGLGDCFNAEKMLPITSTHLVGPINAIYKAGAMYYQEMAEKGGKFVTFATVNPQLVDIRTWRDKNVGTTEERFKEQMAVNDAIAKMGGSMNYSCIPYLVGHLPRFREHIAWSESSAIVFANSVLGARTNREGVSSSLAASLCGRTPAYGLHLDQNRHGELEIRVTTELHGIADYGTLGEFVGRVSGEKNPVLTGIPISVSIDELTQMGSQVCTSGDVALFHVVGVTPEAPIIEAAFGPKKKGTWQVIEFGKKELKETETALSKATGDDVELVILGCPHVSIQQLRDLARLLDGKKLKSGLELWITTSHITTNYAKNMGYVDIIEASGARVLSDVCPLFIAQDNKKNHGPRVTASDSARIVFYMTPIQGVSGHYGSTERCIQAAITGKWR